MMAIFRQASLLSILLLVAPKALGLQVTPNSPCASKCIDDPSLDVSDPNSSNTYSDDIVCADADYTNTAAGRKYEACVDCLRNSTATDDGENDQSWFLYNIRYALDSCLFGFGNATDAESTPCSTQTSCGPLQEALGYGDLSPNNESTYGYCSAGNNVLLGSSLDGCISCLQDVTTETYLANWASTSAKKKGLSEGAIIGVVAGVVILAVIAAAVSLICYRKFRRNRNMTRLISPFDSRFGSKNISSPNSGAYGNPYASPPTQTPPKFDISALSQKELKALGLQMPSFSKQGPNSRVPLEEDGTWHDSHAHFEANESQLPSYTAIPAHQAYIPAVHGNASTSTSATSNTFPLSSIPSSRSSPNGPPPAATSAPVVPRPGIKAIPPPIIVPQARNQTLPQQVQQVIIPRNNIQSIPEQSQPAQALARQSEGTSQIPRPPLHSQKTTKYNPVAYPAMVESNPPSRTDPITGNWMRTRSPSRNGRNRSTSRNGGRNRSTSRNGLRDTFASMDVPVRISGPMIKHGGRFDFDFNEEEWRERQEGGVRTKADVTPSSAESAEQWPGAY